MMMKAPIADANKSIAESEQTSKLRRRDLTARLRRNRRHSAWQGFAKTAPYYYTGWHEPGSILEITFNKARWEKLSAEHQAIITAASEEMTANMLQEFRYENAKALQKLPKDVQIKTFPKDMMDAAKVALGEVLEAESAKSEDFKRVLKSQQDFVKINKPWDDISTKNFLEIRG